MHNVSMRLVRFFSGIAAPLLLAGVALTPGLESRAFTGTGSVGSDGSIEFYLPEGTYHHRLFGTPGCSVTAGVVPARGGKGGPISDLLREADLSVGPHDPDGLDPTPAVGFSVPNASWVNLLVGSGTSCQWAYSITGPFLTEDGMLRSPPQRTQWWLVISAALTTIGLVVAASRQKSTQQSANEETAIRVMDG
jgi:hypothetical protein